MHFIFCPNNLIWQVDERIDKNSFYNLKIKKFLELLLYKLKSYNYWDTTISIKTKRKKNMKIII